MWEIESSNNWKEAKKLAEEGWELVSVCSEAYTDREGDITSSVQYYFKKLKL